MIKALIAVSLLLLHADAEHKSAFNETLESDIRTTPSGLSARVDSHRHDAAWNASYHHNSLLRRQEQLAPEVVLRMQTTQRWGPDVWYVYGKIAGQEFSFLPCTTCSHSWVTDKRMDPKLRGKMPGEMPMETNKAIEERLETEGTDLIPANRHSSTIKYGEHDKVVGRMYRAQMCLGTLCVNDQPFLSVTQKTSMFNWAVPTSMLALSTGRSNWLNFPWLAFKERRLKSAQFSFCSQDGKSFFYIGGRDQRAYSFNPNKQERLKPLSYYRGKWAAELEGFAVKAQEGDEHDLVAYDPDDQGPAVFAASADMIQLPYLAFERLAEAFHLFQMVQLPSGMWSLAVLCNVKFVIRFKFFHGFEYGMEYPMLPHEYLVYKTRTSDATGERIFCRTVFVSPYVAVGKPRGDDRGPVVLPSSNLNPLLVQEYILGVPFLKLIHSTFIHDPTDQNSPEAAGSSTDIDLNAEGNGPGIVLAKARPRCGAPRTRLIGKNYNMQTDDVLF